MNKLIRPAWLAITTVVLALGALPASVSAQGADEAVEEIVRETGLDKVMFELPGPWIEGVTLNRTARMRDELIGRFPLEERIYRLRCVEGWSMVIPWVGFELNELIAAAGPRSNWPTAILTRSIDRKVVELPGPPPVTTKGSARRGRSDRARSR